VGHHLWRQLRARIPLPWANQPDRSHLATPEQLRTTIESGGFAIEQWNDLTEQAATLMQALLALPANPLGLHAFVADFEAKAKNLTSASPTGGCELCRASRARPHSADCAPAASRG